MTKIKHLDGSHWAFILLGIVSIGTIVCFAMAVAAQSHSTHAEAEILMTDNFPAPTDL